MVLEFYRPTTTQDVLDWKLWAECLEDKGDVPGTTRQILAGIQWACKWLKPVKANLPWTPDALSKILRKQFPDDKECFVETISLFNAIADSACLPKRVLEDLSVLLDRKNEIDPEWKPKPPCKCVRCRMAAKGWELAAIRELPKEPCIYDKIHPNAVIASMHVDQADFPLEAYYIAQVRAVKANAETRRLLHREEESEDKKTSQQMLDDTRARIFN